MIRLRTRPEPLPRTAGWAVLGVFAIFSVAGAARRIPDRPLLGVVALVIALCFGVGAVLGPRRTLLASAVGASIGVAVLANGTASNVGWFGICVLAAWLALSASLVETAGYAVGAVLLFLGELLFAAQDPGWASWIGGTLFSVIGCWFGRRQHELVVQLRDAQAGLAARAQAEERNRIAREVHDVIAHSLTVSLLHVSSARLALDEDRAEAERALEEAERLGRQSLDEVRHAVGLLRQDGGADPAAPLPGSLDVPGLIDRFRAAGVDVRADVNGDLTALPNTVGLATYRILQEALTNAAKHAPNSTASVRVSVAPDAVRLSVDSSGAPRATSRPGLGLVGMRERAESLGGDCQAGPGGSGWLVRAELPLGRSA